MIDNDIKVEDNFIVFESDKFKFDLKKDVTEEENFEFYHLIVSTEKTDSIKLEIRQRYINLLKRVKKILLKYLDNIEVLWDDVSFSYSMEAYPLLYKTENMPRKIFSKFIYYKFYDDFNKLIKIFLKNEFKIESGYTLKKIDKKLKYLVSQFNDFVIDNMPNEDSLGLRVRSITIPDYKRFGIL